MLKSFKHYIDGEFSDAAQTFDSINPATGAVWATMPAASTADVDRAVRAADRALFAPEWASLNASQRGKLLYRLADLVAANARELAELETSDTRKIIRQTRSHIGYVHRRYHYFTCV